MADPWDHDRALDVRGLACPLPVLKARKALAGMAPGARLLVAATDPVARIDMPHFCAEAGHRLLLAESRDGVHRFLIGRGGSPPTATR
jgi:tRNA 2-thiouridine synthesizing protein A